MIKCITKRQEKKTIVFDKVQKTQSKKMIFLFTI